MITQLGEILDRRMEANAVRLKAIDKALADLNKERDGIFADSFKIFDAAGHAGKPFKYIAETGMIVERRKSNPEPRLDTTALQERLIAAGQGALFARIAKPIAWEVDIDKLTRAVRNGRISPEIVSASMTNPQPQVSRWHRAAGKADWLWLRIKGAKLTPEQDKLADEAAAEEEKAS